MGGRLYESPEQARCALYSARPDTVIRVGDTAPLSGRSDTKKARLSRESRARIESRVWRSVRYGRMMMSACVSPVAAIRRPKASIAFTSQRYRKPGRIGMSLTITAGSTSTVCVVAVVNAR